MMSALSYEPAIAGLCKKLNTGGLPMDPFLSLHGVVRSGKDPLSSALSPPEVHGLSKAIEEAIGQ